MGILRFRAKAYAFTLIELLIVIAIIAILAAILFPVFESARDKARQSTCASNEKQLALAILQYTQDNDETYPGWRTENSTFSGNAECYAWTWVISPYVKANAAYTCPSQPIIGSVMDYTINMYAIAYDTGGAGNPYGSGYFQARSATAMPFPGNTVLLADALSNAYTAASSGDGSVVTAGPVTPNPTYPAYYFGLRTNDHWVHSGSGYTSNNVDFLPEAITGATSSNLAADALPAGTVHSGGANYAFCDGHVKWMAAEAVTGTGGVSSDLGDEVNSGGRPSGGPWDLRPPFPGPPSNGVVYDPDSNLIGTATTYY